MIKLNIAIAFLFGFMINVGLSFLLEFMDNTFKTKEQLEQVIGVPVIGQSLVIWINKMQQAPMGKKTIGVFICF